MSRHKRFLTTMLKNLNPKRLSKRQQASVALAGSVLLAFIAVTIAIVQQNTPKADIVTSTTTISNQASVSFCTEGETGPACDPASNTYTGTATSNRVSTVKSTQVDVQPGPTAPPAPNNPPVTNPPVNKEPATTTKVIKIKVALQGRTSDQAVKIARIEIQNGSGAAIAKKENVTTAQDGSLSISDTGVVNAVSDGTTYTIVVKPYGYLPTKASTASILSKETTVSPQIGDFRNTGTSEDKVTLVDLIKAIKAFRGESVPEVTDAFGRKPSLSDLVLLIKNFRNTN